MHSLDHFLLQHGILVELGHVLLRVQFVAACLRDRHNEAPSQAATHQNSHDAEVENHGPLGVHMLNLDIIFLAQIWVSRGVLWVNIVFQLQDVRSQNLVMLLLHFL